jgi:hypothetical protein
MGGAQGQQSRQLLTQLGQKRTNTQREKLVRCHRPGVERQSTEPSPQYALFMAGLGAMVAQGLAEVVDSHGMGMLSLHRTANRRLTIRYGDESVSCSTAL